MSCIISNSRDPYFNLALEEHLFKKKEEDFFLLYINEPSVIVGKHQNLPAEVNMNFVIRNKIKLARRLSGGGTVYHDGGNLNFSFIMNGEQGRLIDFKKHTAPVRAILERMGLETRFEGHNSITLKGLKISGNAEHIFKNRILHHGTLLFSTNLDRLEEVLKVEKGVYSDKAVKSVRAEVTNISGYLDREMQVEEFMQDVMELYKEMMPGSADYSLTKEDSTDIAKLQSEKYATQDWVFSYSPAYDLSKGSIISGREIRVGIKVEKGEIKEAEIGGDLLEAGQCRMLEKDLKGKMHRPEIMMASWQKIVPEKEFRTAYFF